MSISDEIIQVDDEIYDVMPDEFKNTIENFVKLNTDFSRILLNPNFLDSNWKKRDAMKSNTNYDAKDVLTKPAKIEYSKQHMQISPGDFSTLTSNNRGAHSIFINVEDKNKNFNELMIQCKEMPLGLDPEAFLAQQEEDIQNLEFIISITLEETEDLLNNIKKKIHYDKSATLSAVSNQPYKNEADEERALAKIMGLQSKYDKIVNHRTDILQEFNNICKTINDNYDGLSEAKKAKIDSEIYYNQLKLSPVNSIKKGVQAVLSPFSPTKSSEELIYEAEDKRKKAENLYNLLLRNIDKDFKNYEDYEQKLLPNDFFTTINVNINNNPFYTELTLNMARVKQNKIYISAFKDSDNKEYLEKVNELRVDRNNYLKHVFIRIKKDTEEYIAKAPLEAEAAATKARAKRMAEQVSLVKADAAAAAAAAKVKELAAADAAAAAAADAAAAAADAAAAAAGKKKKATVGGATKPNVKQAKLEHRRFMRFLSRHLPGIKKTNIEKENMVYFITYQNVFRYKKEKFNPLGSNKKAYTMLEEDVHLFRKTNIQILIGKINIILTNNKLQEKKKGIINEMIVYNKATNKIDKFIKLMREYIFEFNYKNTTELIIYYECAKTVSLNSVGVDDMHDNYKETLGQNIINATAEKFNKSPEEAKTLLLTVNKMELYRQNDKQNRLTILERDKKLLEFRNEIGLKVYNDKKDKPINEDEQRKSLLETLFARFSSVFKTTKFAPKPLELFDFFKKPGEESFKDTYTPNKLKDYDISAIRDSRAEPEGVITMMYHELVEACYESYQQYLESETLAVVEMNGILKSTAESLINIYADANFISEHNLIEGINSNEVQFISKILYHILVFPLAFGSTALYKEGTECERSHPGSYQPQVIEILKSTEVEDINTKYIVPTFESFIKSVSNTDYINAIEIFSK